MGTWLSEHWYYLTGFGGTALVLVFYVYARQHPEGAAMSLWRRAKWTLFGGIAVMMILMLTAALATIFAPQWELIPFFLSTKVYWLEIPIFIVAWFLAPYLQRRFPVSPFDRN
jgi:hypothetical protein